ncbi:DUF1643 domain-containing protein [Oscillibacter sp. MSJ-2]|uniref:DUF1643 domain-containing protein n=1 Tax=Dysosmobacter acutus TaxID=2841504 RepID=A0ABS6F9W9_9FIRM|nr:DUF1643 domain-containing protein [Dysosmobacter acutus]MBU5627094.1 DUF1643 domain-containing protein [Dysosmobacter acutus]
MHIPQTATENLKLLTFQQALELSGQPQQDYDIAKWLYVPPRYEEYRYLLGTRGERPLICVGINPSTAAPDRLDNTLKSVERVAKFNGYDSFLMFNVYAQRATNPNDMERSCNASLHRENWNAFRYALSCSSAPAVWAAWGAIVEKRGYLCDCLRDLTALGRTCGARWFSAGPILKSGHPHHPLYLKKDSLLRPFDMDAYLARLKEA